MKLKISVLAVIRNNKMVKNRLALELDYSSYTIERWIKENDDNLTKASSMKIIREELGLTDSEILEEETIKATH